MFQVNFLDILKPFIAFAYFKKKKFHRHKNPCSGIIAAFNRNQELNKR